MKLPNFILDAIVYVGHKMRKYKKESISPGHSDFLNGYYKSIGALNFRIKYPEAPEMAQRDILREEWNDSLWRMHRQMGQGALAKMTRVIEDCEEAEWQPVKPIELN